MTNERRDQWERRDQLLGKLRIILLAGSTPEKREAADELDKKLTEILHDFTERTKT